MTENIQIHPCFNSTLTLLKVYPTFSTFYLQHKPRPSIAHYSPPSGISNASCHPVNKNQKPPHATHTGLLSRSARKALYRAANLLIEATPTRPVFNHIVNRKTTFKLSFLTLTLPFDICFHSEKMLHRRLLTPLIDWLKKYWGLLNYVWKVERTKRGRIHFHLMADCFCLHSELRRRWNKLILLLPEYTNYKVDHPNTNMPSTEITGVYDSSRASRYLAKYMGKLGSKLSNSLKVYDELNQDPTQFATDSTIPIQGRVWGCSDNLKLAKAPTFNPNDKTFLQLAELHKSDPKAVLLLEYAIVLFKPREFAMKSLDFFDRFQYREFLNLVSPPDHHNFSIN